MGKKQKEKGKSRKSIVPDEKPKPPVQSTESNMEGILTLKRFGAKGIFWDTTLAKLRIQQNVKNRFLTKEVRPKTPPKDTYCVRRHVYKPGTVIHNYSVARPIMPETETSLWIPKGHEGVQLDKDGCIVSHSILGSVDEYVEEARRQGDLVATPVTPTGTPKPLLSNMSDVRSEEQCPKHYADQEHALVHYKYTYDQRRKLRKFIAKTSRRSDKDLAMRENVKTYRVGGKIRYPPSADIWAYERNVTDPVGFWKQRSQLGDDLRCIHVSLTNTEKGHPPGKVIVGKPLVCDEDNTDKTNLDQGDSQIIPDIVTLGIAGHNISNMGDALPLRTNSIVTKPSFHVPIPNKKPPKEVSIKGPALRIIGKTIFWGEDDKVVDVELGVVAQPGDVGTASLQIENISSCVIHYEFVRIHSEDTFNLAEHTSNRLYLDDAYGIVLPMDTNNVSFIFRSQNAGVFSERWRLHTTPKLAANGGIHLTIWGMAKEEIELGENGEEIEEYLGEKIKLTSVNDIISELLNVACFEKTEKREKYKDFPPDMQEWPTHPHQFNELFVSTHTGLTYHSGKVGHILELAALAMPDTDIDKWSLPLNYIRDSFFDMPETIMIGKEVVPRTDITQKFMVHVGTLSFDVQQPISDDKTHLCKQLLVGVLNDICDVAFKLKRLHGITLDMDFKVELPKEEHPPTTPTRSPPKPPSKSPLRDVKKKKNVSHSPPVVAKKTSTGSSRFSNIIRGIASGKKALYERRAKPIMYTKYLEKLNIRTYIIIQNMLDRLQSYLSDYPIPAPSLTLD